MEFSSGTKLAFCLLENDFDVYHHQSAEYHFIGFDELTQFTEFQYTFMISRARRLEGSFVPIRIRSASNPPGLVRGEFGEWSKSRFLPWFTCSACGNKEQTADLKMVVCSKCGSTTGHVEFNEDRTFAG